MGVAEIILGIVLLVLAVALVALVLMQQGKDKRLSGAIAGGSDTFYGKSKIADKDKIYSIATTVCAIVFVVIVVLLAVLNRDLITPNVDGPEPTDTEASESVASPEEDKSPAGTPDASPEASVEEASPSK